MNLLDSNLNPDTIEFLGTISENEKKLLLDRTDIFINLSLDEGFGIPVHEAAEKGCWLILSNIDVFKHYCSEYSPLYVDIFNFDTTSFIYEFQKWIQVK